MFKTFLRSITDIFVSASRILSYVVIGTVTYWLFGDLVFAVLVVYAISLINVLLNILNDTLLDAALVKAYSELNKEKQDEKD